MQRFDVQLIAFVVKKKKKKPSPVSLAFRDVVAGYLHLKFLNL